MAGQGGVIWIQWYATILRGDLFADMVAEQAAPVSLKYGATKYAVHRSRDDRYKITQMVAFPDRDDWYRYWEGPEMKEFRARYSGKFQIPIVYVWNDEIAYHDTYAPAPVDPDAEDADVYTY